MSAQGYLAGNPTRELRSKNVVRSHGDVVVQVQEAATLTLVNVTRAAKRFQVGCCWWTWRR